MKIRILILIALISLDANACVISPFHTTIVNAEKLFVKSDISFFGRLDTETINAEIREQIAVFTVIKSLKGNVSGQISIVNDLSSSCSRVFETPMSAYYVFAERDDDGLKYRINGRATFVPLEYAMEDNWSPKLGH